MPTVTSRLSVDGRQVELVDLANNTTIIGMVNQVYLWDDMRQSNTVRPTVELRPQPTGFDLVYTFTNETAAPKTLGRMRLGSMLLGSQMTWQDYTYLGEDNPADASSFVQITRNYPASWYSPVVTFRNADYAVGVSFLYPMMEYKHDVRIVLNNNGVEGRGNIGWEAMFQLQNSGNEGQYDRVRYQGELQPGETRTYVIAVRVSRDRNDYIRTLLPYRDFFQKMYGGVRYARNTEPIIGFSTGITTCISEDNPYGFGSWRPDLYGWNGFTTGLRGLPGWKNVMVWKPTGHYKNNRGGNMPFNFTTQWLADPELATATDPNVGFPTVVAAGKNLGFWWGHACSVSDWDAHHSEPLDPDNPDHVRRANAELDLAVQAGATIIGLDTFHPWLDAPWNLTRWLQMMRVRHPQLRFVAEPISFDILHSLSPAFITGFSGGNPQTVEDLYPLKQPHTLANFILPGNEIWASMMYAPHSWLHITPTEEMINDDIARYARLGFTTIVFPPIDVTLQNRPDQRAAEAWNTVVPADLLASYRWNRNYNNGAIVRRADGSMAIIEASSPSRDTPAPPPQPAGPPQGLDGGSAGGGGDTMVLGSAPDAGRHASKSSKRAKAAPVNLAEATPDQITSTQAPDFATGSGRVNTKVRNNAVKQNTKVDTRAPKDHQSALPAPPSADGGGGASLHSRGPGAVSVVPSSIPGMRLPGTTASNPNAGAAGRLDAGLNLTAVRQAILRAQRARPVPGANVVEVER